MTGIQARIAQLVAYWLGTGEVLGSNPGKGEKFFNERRSTHKSERQVLIPLANKATQVYRVSMYV